MDKILDFIKKNKLIKPGEVIGVGVSGGIDSMCLLHFLNANKQLLDIDVVAIHINHGIREESVDAARFVMQKCKEMGVRVYKFTIDSPKIAKDKKISLETAAREGRYGVFGTPHCGRERACYGGKKGQYGYLLYRRTQFQKISDDLSSRKARKDHDLRRQNARRALRADVLYHRAEARARHRRASG